jgi:hypothetical protein
MKKHIIIAAVACICLCVVTLALTRARSSAPTDVKKFRAMSVRDRAKEAGRVTGTARSTNLVRFNDVASLTKESSIIVTGTVQSEHSFLLPPKETLVVTDSIVKVDQNLKGNAGSDTITVRAPGGAVAFPDGTLADLKMPDFWRNPQISKTYVFFLEQRDGYFALHGGPQGLFEITAKGISPQVRLTDQLMKTYKGKETASFLKEVRQAAK